MLKLSVCKWVCHRASFNIGSFIPPKRNCMVMANPKTPVSLNNDHLSSTSIGLENALVGRNCKSREGAGEGCLTPTQYLLSENNPHPSATGLRQDLMPKHVAAILDGNRRWAKAHGKELDYDAFCYGYLALADLCIKWGIPTLTCFMFSTENWKRTKEANDLLFGQFKTCLEESRINFMRKGIKVSIIGEKTKLPKDLQEVIKEVEEVTEKNSKMELNFAVSYGGKRDIVEAIRSISMEAKAGNIEVEQVDEPLMNQMLSTNGLKYPDPDLLIRTGGDQRTSNLLTWQMSHTEFYFTQVYGPDFGEPDFIDALHWYQQCDRLFGK